MTRLIIILVRLYQKLRSFMALPGFLPIQSQCRFYPSCSDYAVMSVEKNGAWKGISQSIYRIIRCNPFNKGGIDLP